MGRMALAVREHFALPFRGEQGLFRQVLPQAEAWESKPLGSSSVIAVVVVSMALRPGVAWCSGRIERCRPYQGPRIASNNTRLSSVIFSGLLPSEGVSPHPHRSLR
jgi:hypothetical protein